MIERRGADLDLAALRRFAIGRKHQAKEFELLGFQGGFIALGKVFPLLASRLTTSSLASQIHPSRRAAKAPAGRANRAGKRHLGLRAARGLDHSNSSTKRGQRDINRSWLS